MTEWLMQTDIWRWQNLLGLTACACLLVSQIGIPAPLKMLWGYAMLSSLWVFQYPTKTAKYSLCFDQTTGQAFSQLVLLPMGVLSIPAKYFRHWRLVFTGVAVFQTAALAAFGFGLMSAKSFDTALIAMIVPVVSHPLLQLFLVVNIFYHGGSTAFLILFIGEMIRMRRHKLVGLTAAFLLVPWFLIHGFKLFDSSGRVMFWEAFFKWWVREPHFLFGTGVGTFEWLPRLVKDMQLDDRIFLQMHSDWLQFLFEGGAVGLTLMIASFVVLIKKSMRSHFSAVAGVGVCMLTYHPAHFFISGLFILCLIREVLENAATIQKE